MKNLVIYVHGKGGNAEEAEHFKHKPFFENADVFGFDYKAQTPWEAKEEFPRFFENKKQEYGNTILIANSIGAYFSMSALSKKELNLAFLISPVFDMEKLIENMMRFSNVGEEELKTKKEIPTDFGETLSWKYLSYARNNPINWDVPTYILYGEYDNLTSFETISAFSKKSGAKLSVMKHGEHWFHTEEQLKFMDEWLKNSISDAKKRSLLN